MESSVSAGQPMCHERRDDHQTKELHFPSPFVRAHWPIATHAVPLRNTLIHRHSYIHTDPFVRLSWSVVPPVRSLKIIVSHAPSSSHNYNHTVMFVLSPRTYNWWNTAVLLLLLCNCRTRKQDRLMRWNAITLQVLLQNSIKQWK